MLLDPLAECRYRQGLLSDNLSALGRPLLEHLVLDALVDEVVSTSAIEGELLDAGQVRSSLAPRLGIEHDGLPLTDRRVAGIVDMVLDATLGYDAPLDATRLLSWHLGLFPDGVSDRPGTVGAWRPDGSGEMRVVSLGRWGREQVHFVVPAPERLPDEIAVFLQWYNTPSLLDPVVKAGLAHLWFVTIYLFEDGNGGGLPGR